MSDRSTDPADTHPAARTRRALLRGFATAAAGCCAAGALAGVVARESVARERRRRPSGSVRLADADLPAEGQTVLVEMGGAPVLLLARAGVFHAWDARCTHAGCEVHPDDDGRLACPCHGGLFDDTTGEPLDGPPKTPLQRLQVSRPSDGGLLITAPRES